ncbi:MAG: hypothetical protein KAS21_05755 [Candidatus Aminicenantes bacterium]|nr:hypothetical protein [Candidatus Aminicenantes bacterium]
MIKKRVEAFYKEEKGSINILSPGIGIFETKVRGGDILSPGSYFGNLNLMGSISGLYLPDNISGIVEPGENNLLVFPVGYKTPVLSLKSERKKTERVQSNKTSQKSDKSRKSEIIITAFTTGIFYTKPSPESPPFISSGSVIHKGSVLGLIEVMKSFNQIIFTGDEKYEKGKVLKVLEEDSSEVRQGDPLFIISVD